MIWWDHHNYVLRRHAHSEGHGVLKCCYKLSTYSQENIGKLGMMCRHLLIPSFRKTIQPQRCRHIALICKDCGDYCSDARANPHSPKIQHATLEQSCHDPLCVPDRHTRRHKARWTKSTRTLESLPREPTEQYLSHNEHARTGINAHRRFQNAATR